MESLSDMKKDVLLQLNHLYRQENQTPILMQPINYSTPIASNSGHLYMESTTSSSKDCVNVSADCPSLVRQSSFLARGRLMVSKAKHKSSLCNDVDGDCTSFPQPVTTQRPGTADFSHIGKL